MSDEKPTFNLAIIEAHKLSRFDPLRGFTPRKLTTALDQFRVGRLRELALIIEAQEERDDVLACVVPKSKSAVARHGWEILTVKTQDEATKALAQKQQEVLRNFYDQLRVTNALDQDELGGVSLLLRQMMDAKSKRYAVHNIVWKPGRMPTATLWFTPLWFFENSTGKMRFISQPFGYDGEDMAADEWLVTKGLGVGIACAVAWTFKHMTLRDWVLYNSICGRPGFEGVTDAKPGSAEWQNMVSAVAQAASEFRWVRNRTEEIKTIDFGAKGELPFPALVERMDRALSALWRGADLSTISAGRGQGQGASLQGTEASNIEQDDAQWLSETLQLKLDRLVLNNVFGPDVPSLAYFKVLGDQKTSVEVDIKVDTFLVGAGFPITHKDASERYGRALPDGESGEDYLKAPAAAPVAASPAGPMDPGNPPGTDPAQVDAQAINEAGGAGRRTLFDANAMNRLRPEMRAVMAPFAERLTAIAAITDPGEQGAALAKFRSDMPAMYRAATAKVPAVAGVLEQIIGTAFASGAAEESQKLKKP